MRHDGDARQIECGVLLRAAAAAAAAVEQIEGAIAVHSASSESCEQDI